MRLSGVCVLLSDLMSLELAVLGKFSWTVATYKRPGASVDSHVGYNAAYFGEVPATALMTAFVFCVIPPAFGIENFYLLITPISGLELFSGDKFCKRALVF